MCTGDTIKETGLVGICRLNLSHPVGGHFFFKNCFISFVVFTITGNTGIFTRLRFSVIFDFVVVVVVVVI